MKKLIPAVISSCLLIGCQTQNPESNSQDLVENEVQSIEVDLSKYPEILQKALSAHGGLETWRKYSKLEYTLSWPDKEGTEKQIINLNNRKVLINRDTVKVGFNGEVVWVSPDLGSFGGNSARFYHNLYFYFFGIPYLLSDPGIIYEDLGEKTVDDKTYYALKVSYESGVGDSPEDLYIAHFNTETYQLELLLYTVTYFSGEKHTNYNALYYPDWVKVDGLMVPTTLKGYKYEEGQIGELRYEVAFSNINFSQESPAEEIFEMPKVAEIDSLKKN